VRRATLLMSPSVRKLSVPPDVVIVLPSESALVSTPMWYPAAKRRWTLATKIFRATCFAQTRSVVGNSATSLLACLASIPIGGGRGHERHRCLAGPAHLAEVRSHAVGDAAECGAGTKLMNVPRALLRGPDGLRQNCRTANGEFADMGLQTGENVPSARLDVRAQGLDIRGAIPLRGEQPFLRPRPRNR
jgi:hypothetical protein